MLRWKLRRLRSTNPHKREKAIQKLAVLAGREPEIRRAIISALRDPGVGVRSAAASAIKYFPAGLRIEHLKVSLEDSQADVRIAGVEQLGYIEDPHCVNLGRQALKDISSSVRRAASEMAGITGRIDFLESLLSALNDNSPEVRRTAAWSLSRLADKRAVEPLKKSLTDPDWHVRRAAQKSLETLGVIQMGQGEGPLQSNAYAVLARARCGSQGIRDADLTKSGEIWEQANGLISRGSKEVITAINAGNEDIREAACIAVGLLHIQSERNAGLAAKVLRESDSPEMTAMANGVSTLDYMDGFDRDRLVENLLNSLHDRDCDVRRAAAWSLGKLDDCRKTYPLIQALKDPDWHVRRTAAYSLDCGHGPDSEGDLIKAIADIDSDMREPLFQGIVKSVRAKINIQFDITNRPEEYAAKLHRITSEDPLAAMLTGGSSLTFAQARQITNGTVTEFVDRLSDSVRKLLKV